MFADVYDHSVPQQAAELLFREIAPIYPCCKRPLISPLANECPRNNFVAIIHCIHLRNHIFVSSAGTCPTSQGCCLSSSTVTLRLELNSATGLILPLLCSRVAYHLLDTAMGLLRRKTARYTLLEGEGRTVRPLRHLVNGTFLSAPDAWLCSVQRLERRGLNLRTTPMLRNVLHSEYPTEDIYQRTWSHACMNTARAIIYSWNLTRRF